MARELTQALRSLRRSPWYSVTVVSVIALSMALSGTVFAIVDGVLFKPLAYKSPDQLFGVSVGFSKLPDSMRQLGSVSPADIAAWREALPDAALTAFTSNDQANIGPNETARTANVDLRFFDVVGTSMIGAGFGPGDFSGNMTVKPAVVTYEFWTRRLGENHDVLGKSFVGKDGTGIRIVGILPKDFAFPSNSFPPEVVTPLVLADLQSRGRFLSVLVRIPAGASATEGTARLTAVARTLAATAPPVVLPPDTPERTRIFRGPYDVVRLDPIRDVLTARFSQNSWIVFGVAAGLVLLACLNVTGLAVARVQDRWRDLVLRRALGARYIDLVRLLAIESAVLVVAGAVIGTSLAQLLLRVTVELMSKGTFFLKVPVIDARVLALAGFTAALCVLLISLLPARAAWRTSLKTQGPAATSSQRRFGGWSIVSGQVALALVMTIGGALVAGSLLRVWNEEPGFDVDRTALLEIGTPKGMSAAAIEQFLSSIRQVPGVKDAGGVTHPLLERAFNGSEFDHPPGAIQTGQFPIESMPITSGYLQAAGMVAMDGRLPTGTEVANGAPVLVVSELVARQYWPGQRAVGQSLANKGRPFTVVGVVRDARYMSLDLEPQGAIYWASAASARPLIGNVLVSGNTSGSFRLADVVARVTAACSECVLRKAQMLNEVLAASVRQRRFSAWLFSSFGIAALVIVGTGILGLVAMTTGRRTKEMGIRLALGSTRSGIVREILRQQVLAVGLGLVAGGVIAIWAVRFWSAYLYKTTLYDAWAWGAAIAALVLIALVGGLVPSLSASRVDPIRALRVE